MHIDNIILAGSVLHSEFEKILKKGHDKNVSIETLKLPNLNTDNINSATEKNLPLYAVSIGAAWRALDSSNENLYTTDLTPFKIKEEQKVLKLGITGWILFMLIPLLTFFITLKINQLERDYKRLHIKHQQRKNELSRLQEINNKVDVERKKYSYYQNTYGILDSLITGTETWSEFLTKIAHKSKEVGNIWITEIETFGSANANLKGYSTKRDKIPVFSDSIGKTVLRQVQVQTIKRKTIYSFEIEVEVPVKNPAVLPLEETGKQKSEILAQNK